MPWLVHACLLQDATVRREALAALDKVPCELVPAGTQGLMSMVRQEAMAADEDEAYLCHYLEEEVA
jgi:mannitol-1-phosphate/altronate dehydrogenase